MLWEHFNKSLEIKRLSLPSNHPDIAKTLASMGHVFKVQGDLQEASAHFRGALQIFQRTYPPKHPCVMQIENDIQHMQSNGF